MRDLLEVELDSVSGGSRIPSTTEYNGTTAYTDYFDSNNNFVGTLYQFDNGTSRYWDATTGEKTDFGSTYTNIGVAYWGLTAGVMSTWSGNTYAYGGFGMPGVTLSQGYDLDGNLSGWSVSAARTPSGLVSIVVDPTTGTVTGTEAGVVSPSVTYAIDITNIQVNSLESIVYTFANGFVETYYPNPTNGEYPRLYGDQYQYQ